MAKSRVTPRSKDETGSRQLVEQRLGLLQHRRVEAFGEPVVDRRQQIAGLDAFALIAPEGSEASGGAEFPEFGTLLLRHCDRAVKTLFRSGVLIHGQQ